MSTYQRDTVLYAVAAICAVGAITLAGFPFVKEKLRERDADEQRASENARRVEELVESDERPRAASSSARPTKTGPTTTATAPPAIVAPVPLDRFTTQRAIRGSNFGDSPDGPHEGGKDFLAWALLNLVYEDVFDADLQRTTFAKAMRDADIERTRRMCVTGTVVDIEGADAAGERFYAGTLVDDQTNPTLFIAVGDADKVFADSVARFCGVVVGRESYQSVGGQRLTGIRAIGMFDTPTNKKRTREALKNERLP